MSDLTKGLVAYYPFNGNANDESGKGNDGEVHGAALTADRFGNPDRAYQFDGKDDYIAINELNFSKAGEIKVLTVTAWVKVPPDGGNWSIVDFDRSHYFCCAAGIPKGTEDGEGDYVGFHTGGADGIKDMWGNSPVRDNQWHHIAWVFDSCAEFNKKIYIDGVLDAEQTAHAGGIGRGKPRYGFIGVGSEAETSGGARNEDTYFKGAIADIRIYLRALSHHEIMELIQTGAQQHLPAYETIFGKLDFKKGDEARSVYSPAAYLVDLLQIMHDEFDPGNPLNKSFEQRRQDIGEIVLDAENTFGIIPYLDIVNEVLEKQVGTDDPYEVLKNACFPFNLPFHLQNERIKLCLKYLNVTAEQLYKLFAVEEAADIIAREYLGLSREELNVILDPDVTDTCKLLEKYGKPASLAELTKVETFLYTTKISGRELRELLFQNLSQVELGKENVGQNTYTFQENFFINHNLGGYAGLDTEEENLTWSAGPIPDEWFARTHRFIRLAKKTGLSFTHLDLILRDCCGNNLDETAIIKIAVIKTIAAAYDIPIDEVCAFFAPLGTGGHGEEEEPAGLFHRTFNGKLARFSKQYITGPPPNPHQYPPEFTSLDYSGDILAVHNKNYRKRIFCALGISDKDLTFIVKTFRLKEIDETLWSEPDNWSETDKRLKTLSLLFRLHKLVEILDTSYEELFHIFDVLEKEPVIRRFNNFDTFIHMNTEEKNCYKIISGDNIDASMWLVQTLAKLAEWMRENDFTGEELKKIASGDYTEKIELTGNHEKEKNENSEKTEEEKIDIQQKILFLDNLYQQYKPLFFAENLFVSDLFNQRSARLIYESVLESGTLVSKADKRLVFFHEGQAKQAAHRAINRFDLFTRDDFKGLGIEEKIAEKIFKNLVWKGFIKTNGTLEEAHFNETAAENFTIDTDFSGHKEALFTLIADLHEKYIDASIYPSDLKTLELTEAEANQLYDNLVLNGYLDETGALLQPAIFEDRENLSGLEINAHIGDYSNIGAYTGDVFNSIKKQVDAFDSTEITLDKEIFSHLPLGEIQVDDLVENLRYNEYIDEHDVFTDNKKMLAMDEKDFDLALQFYPLRRAVLKAIKDYIAGHRDRFYTIGKELFFEAADNIIGDWVYMAMEKAFLENGRLKKDQTEFFKNSENAAQFDVWWSFDQNDNTIVFNVIRDIVLTCEQYKFIDTPLKEWNFNPEEIDELVGLLQTEGWIDEENKIPDDKLDYFLNIDNALVFSIQAFEDYNKDMFFILHTIAKNVEAGKEQAASQVKTLAEAQETNLYGLLQEVFELPADSIRAISVEVFKGADNVVEAWMAPILSAVDRQDRIIAEPGSFRFNAAYKRIRQFARLANKLKLSPEEIEIAFHDQDLVEKFPENLAMPEKILELPEGERCFDALMETPEGVHMFKGNRYWLFDPVTYELQEKDDKTDRTLEEISLLLKDKTEVDAAFVDNRGSQVIIAGNLYLIKEKGEKIWKIKKDEEDNVYQWGKVDSSFDHLERIDAALTDRDGRVYLFSGDQYVRYTGDTYGHIDEGYPREIAGNFKNEEVVARLHEEFREGLDASFLGVDGQAYFFKDNRFISSRDLNVPQPVNSKWGRIKNNLKDPDSPKTVDAAYVDGEQYFIFSGHQVTAYKDCLENEGLLVSEGFPRRIDTHLPNIPDHFKQGVDAAFKGWDDNLYIFKEGKMVKIDSSGNIIETYEVNAPQNGLAKVVNPLADTGAIDAAFTGLDGKTYLFSGELYYRYSGDDYSRVDPGYPRGVADDWSQLITIDAAFVLDGKTYVFGNKKDEQTGQETAMYIRYSTNDYTKPDEDYPREQNDNWWNFPFSLTGHEIDKSGFKKVDAIFNAMDGKTFLFSGEKFIYFDHMHRWWSEPQTLKSKWDNMPFDHIDAAFTGKDGKTYLFSGDEYIRFSDASYIIIDKGYPRTTAAFWGNVRNNIMETCAVDAALVVKSYVKEEKEVDDIIITEEKMYLHTYLFSGDQYFRYQHLETDAVTDRKYDNVQPGYPRLIAQSLKDEPRFKNAVPEKLQGIKAAFADQRNIYLFNDAGCHVCSDTPEKKYEPGDLPQADQVDYAFIDEGALYVGVNGEMKHCSALEGKSVVTSPRAPVWFNEADVPDQFRTGLNAVLKGTDNNTYLFKDTEVFDLKLQNTAPINQQWGKIRNNIETENIIDAAFLGRDGKTYVFSGDQYISYTDDPAKKLENITGENIQVIADDAPKLIAQKWGGLNRVDIAYVLEGKTYLFEKIDEQGNFRCLRFSSHNYDKPDKGYPQNTGIHFWEIPPKYTDQGFTHVDIILVIDDEMFFIHGQRYLEYNTQSKHWSNPQPLDKKWPFTTCAGCDDNFESMTAAFYYPPGAATYFFKRDCYTAFKNKVFSPLREIKRDWGIVPNILAAKVDAALVFRGVTYLFARDKYIRYSGGDYRLMDDQYPKTIVGHLRKEGGFAGLPDEFEAIVNDLANKDTTTVIIDAAAANDRNIYIHVKDGNIKVDNEEKIYSWFVISAGLTKDYATAILGNIKNNLYTGSRVDAAFVHGDKTYLFSGSQYVRYTGRKYEYIDEDYPKAIAGNLAAEDGMGPVPHHFNKGIDAAFRGSDNHIYLFRDLKYYNSGDAGAGALDIKGTWGNIKNNFIGAPPGKPVDAAFVGPRGELYVFKGDQYIRYSEPGREFVDPEFPKPIKDNWGNLQPEFETGLDGAFTFEANTFFSKGDRFVKYSYAHFDSVAAIYPRQFVLRWADLVDYLLTDIKIITRFKQLQDTYSSDYTLVDLLHRGGGYLKEPYEILAGIFNFDGEEVRWLKRHHAFLDPENPYEARFNLELAVKIFDALTLSGKMRAGISTLYEEVWKKLYGKTEDIDMPQAADALMALLGTRGCQTGQIDVLIDEIHDKLNILKRDALVPYVIANDHTLENVRDLYEKFLIDVQMDSCGRTSRITEAIAALQLFFHRWFVNLEQVDLKGGKDEIKREILKQRWKWMRNYRVWEANRKVFLYPENYIRPELRDTKTPQFKTLEEELLQGEPDIVNITRAYNHYIDQFTEVSGLKIAGGYVYDEPKNQEDKNMILFGHTRSEPRRYYYREATFIGGSSVSVAWQPWKEVNVQIDAEWVYPVYALNKIFVFWALVEIRSNQDKDAEPVWKSENDKFKSVTKVVNESVLQVYYSYLNLNKEWAPPQKLDYEITSNDNIVAFFLDFKGDHEPAREKLDNIFIRCHYTTEKYIKPEIEGNEYAKNSQLISAIKAVNQFNRDDDDIIYLKGIDDRESYFVEHRDDSLAYAARLFPGSLLGNEKKFHVQEGLVNTILMFYLIFGVQVNTEDTISLRIAEPNKPDHYLRHQGYRLKAHQDDGSILFKNDASFKIKKGLIGDGYSFESLNYPGSVLYYDDNNEIWIRRWDELKTHAEKRHATFRLAANRQEQSNTFRFYPETNDTREEQGQGTSATHNVQTGVETFKKLFPNEDVTKISLPVLLNVPAGANQFTWVCFDYKGGSFLCKPVSGETGDAVLESFENLPKGIDLITAAFHRGGETYFFSRDRYWKEGDPTTGLVKAHWGKVKNNIQETGVIDAAVVIRDSTGQPTKTILFSGDQYYIYTNGYDRVDNGYPRKINGNTDELPQWDKVTAAFCGTNGVCYYFDKNGQYVTSDNLSDSGLKAVNSKWSNIPNTFNDPQNKTPVITAFTRGQYTYLVKKNEFIRYTGKTYNYIDDGYPVHGGFHAVMQDLGINNIPDEIPAGSQVQTILVNGNTIHAAAGGSQNWRITNTDTQPLWEKLPELPKMRFNWPSKKITREAKPGGVFTLTEEKVNDEWDVVNKTFKFIKASREVTIYAASTFRDGKVYLFSQKEYMIIKESDITGNDITWRKDGDVSAKFGKNRGITSVDAAMVKDNELYLFSGKQYFKITGDTFETIEPGYPKPITEINSALSGVDKVDAAFFDDNDRITRFFTGTTFFTSEKNSSPRENKDYWGKIKNNFQDGKEVNAAFATDTHTFLFSGDQYIRYTGDLYEEVKTDDKDEKIIKNVDERYPGLLQNNPDGLPEWPNLSAAFQLEGQVYLFHSNGYYAVYDPVTRKYTGAPTAGDWEFPQGMEAITAAYNDGEKLYIIARDKFVTYDNQAQKIPRRQNARYDIIRLSSITGGKFSQALFVDNIDGLMKISMQETDELPYFTFGSAGGDVVIQADENQVDNRGLPINTSLEFNGASGIYYWEIFFHVPYLMAQSLNTAQRFEEAKQWYEFIFDPTEPGTYWKFLPFLAVDMDAIIRAVEGTIQGLHQYQKEKGKEESIIRFAELKAQIKQFDEVFEGHGPMDSDKKTALEVIGTTEAFTTFKASVEDINGQDGKIAAYKQSLLEIIELIKRLPIRYNLMLNNRAQISAYLDDPFDPHAIAALRRIAYRRAIVMAYIDNLIDWGDMLFTQYTRESINEARMLYILAYELLGEKPENVGNKILSDPQHYDAIEDRGAEIDSDTVYDFLYDATTDETEEKSLTFAGTVHDSVADPYFYIPENSILLGYWDRVEDRLYKIRHCLNIMGISQPLPLFQPPIDPMALVAAAAGGAGISAALAQLTVPVPHYRFTFMLNKARELASKLNQFGADLLGAIEKKDGEALSMLQNKQEKAILEITRKIKEEQLKEAEQNLQNLLESKKSAENQRDHYNSLIDEGLIAGEHAQIVLMTTSVGFSTAAAILKIISSVAAGFPQFTIGPFSVGSTMGGEQASQALEKASDALQTTGEVMQMAGEIAAIYAQHKRSVQDWELQEQMATSEIKQLEFQIKGAEHQLKAAQHELESTKMEIKNNEAMKTFMKEKFSNEQLYLWMSGKLAAMFFQTYKLAFDMAKSAERAFIYERGLKESDVNYIAGTYWDNLKKGILAGESLGLDLDRMEKAFLDTDERAFEITKRISLLELDPLAFLELKDKRVCEFHFTEALFDYDFQGHYKRQIKTIAFELDAGEGVTVNATLTQLKNKTVMEPDTKAVKYLLSPKDEQPETIRSDWRPNRQIAFSHVGEYDDNNGLFEMRYDDERYLPFEGTGAVSSWRFELNGKRGSYNIDDLKDVVIVLKYTARQGGDAFAAAVKGMLKPYPASVMIRMAEKFPNEWFAFVYGETEDLKITVTRDMFPNMSGSKINAVFTDYRYNEKGQATLTLNDTLELTDKKLLLSPGLSIGAAGTEWTFKAKGDKRALEDMGMVLTYKAVV